MTPTTPDEFRSWVEPHLDMMHRVASRLGRYDAADTVQDALLAAWSKRHQYDPSKGTASAWLARITTNCARRQFRRRSSISIDLTNEAANMAPHVSAESSSHIDLQRAVGSLPRKQRLVTELFYYVDLSIEDIAYVMNCSHSSVKVALHAARKNIRNSLGDDYR